MDKNDPRWIIIDRKNYENKLIKKGKQKEWLDNFKTKSDIISKYLSLLFSLISLLVVLWQAYKNTKLEIELKELNLKVESLQLKIDNFRIEYKDYKAEKIK